MVGGCVSNEDVWPSVSGATRLLCCRNAAGFSLTLPCLPLFSPPRRASSHLSVAGTTPHLAPLSSSPTFVFFCFFSHRHVFFPPPQSTRRDKLVACIVSVHLPLTPRFKQHSFCDFSLNSAPPDFHLDTFPPAPLTSLRWLASFLISHFSHLFLNTSLEIDFNEMPRCRRWPAGADVWASQRSPTHHGAGPRGQDSH